MQQGRKIRHAIKARQISKRRKMREKNVENKEDLANFAPPDKVVLGWTHTAQYRLCDISANNSRCGINIE